MLARVGSITAFFAAMGVANVHAHGFMYQPLAKFFSSSAFDVTSYVSLIDGYALYPDGTFSTYPTGNVNSFVEHFKNQTTYANIKELINDKQELVSNLVTAECGYTDPSQTSYGAVNSTVLWGQNGFTSSHEGPCEVWCDDNMAAQNMNCALNYPSVNGGPSEVPIDTTKCADASRLTFYWIAMHGSDWQVYINCVNINGATSSADDTTTPTTTTAAPATTTAAPATTTAAPAASTGSNVDGEANESAASGVDDEYDDETEAPVTTQAPAASTEGSVDGEADESAASAVDDEYDEDTPEPASTTATPAATTATPAATTACRRRMRN